MLINYKGWRIWLQDVNVNVIEPPQTGQERDRQQMGGLRKHLVGVASSRWCNILD